jgi:hypothetical protein
MSSPGFVAFISLVLTIGLGLAAELLIRRAA